MVLCFFLFSAVCYLIFLFDACYALLVVRGALCVVVVYCLLVVDF